MAELSVELTAKITDLERQLSKARKDLSKTGDVAEDAGKKIDKGGKQGFGSIKKSSANATPALLEFNRVIQDAPFGIQGVGNNLQQLTANFGQLTKSSGGVVNALKGMFAGLAGPQGILLAVSAVTSLLTVFGDELFRSTNLTKKLAEASGEFVAKAQSEINTLETLVGVSQDKSNSDKVRLGAIDDLNDKYGKYLGNLSLENINTKEVTASVDALTKSLFKQAQVRGIESAISDVYKEAGGELTTLLLNQKAAAKAVKREVSDLRKVAAFSDIDVSKPLTQQIKQIEDIVNRNKGAGKGLLAGLGISVGDFNSAIADTKKFKAELQNEIAPLQELFSDFTVDSLFNEFADTSDFDKGVTVIGDKLGKFKNRFKNLDDVFGINAAVQRSLDAGDGVFQAIEIQFDQFGNSIGGALDRAGNLVAPKLSVIEQALIDFNERADKLIRNNIVNTFAGLGDAIGQTLIDGGNLAQALGKSLLSSVGSVLTQLGELAISTGVGILAVNTALKTLNPYVAIAAGVALVAIGSAFSSGARKIGSGNFNSGSSGVSGQGSSSFSGTPSTSTSNSGGFGSGRVVFEIAGQKLLGVLENTKQANLKIGGNVG